MRLLLSPDAQSDMSEIWDYTAERWGADQAVNYTLRLRDTLVDLAAGRKPSRSAEDIAPGYRTCLVGSHIAYFRIDGNHLIVVRILHQSMDPESRLRP